MSITIRRRTSGENPILTIISAAESDETIGRIVKSQLMDPDNRVLMVNMSTKADIEEMEAIERAQRTELVENVERVERTLRPGEV